MLLSTYSDNNDTIMSEANSSVGAMIILLLNAFEQYAIEALHYDVWYRKYGGLFKCIQQKYEHDDHSPNEIIVIHYRLITTFIEWITRRQGTLVQIFCLDAIDKFMQGFYILTVSYIICKACIVSLTPWCWT